MDRNGSDENQGDEGCGMGWGPWIYLVEGGAGTRDGEAASGARPRHGRSRSWGGGSRPCPSTVRTASSCTLGHGRGEDPMRPLCPSVHPSWFPDDDGAGRRPRRRTEDQSGEHERDGEHEVASTRAFTRPVPCGIWDRSPAQLSSTGWPSVLWAVRGLKHINNKHDEIAFKNKKKAGRDVPQNPTHTRTQEKERQRRFRPLSNFTENNFAGPKKKKKRNNEDLTMEQQ